MAPEAVGGLVVAAAVAERHTVVEVAERHTVVEVAERHAVVEVAVHTAIVKINASHKGPPLTNEAGLLLSSSTSRSNGQCTTLSSHAC
jgi:hypothetical protein